MNPVPALRHLLTWGWDWEPSVLLGCAGLLAAYLAAARWRPPREAPWFAAGVAVLLLALVSPLDTLGDTVLFTAHMLQHLLLVLAVPPLLLLGIPADLARRALRWRPVAALERAVGRPWVAWLVGVGTLWVWHAPSLYDAALAHEGLHVVQHLCFLASAAIFWWPVCAPPGERRLSSLGSVVYLMSAGMAQSLLGILLAFAPRVLYRAYLHPVDPLGVLALIRRDWGLSAAADQGLGGWLMLFLGGLVYMAVILGKLAAWFFSAWRQGGLAWKDVAGDPTVGVKAAEEGTTVSGRPGGPGARP